MSKNLRLKQFFESENITQKEFAQKLDSTQQYVSAILNGKRKVGSNIIERLEKEFNINTAWLLTGEGAMKKDSEVKESHAHDERAEYQKPGEVSLESLQMQIYQVNQNLLSLSEGVTRGLESLAKATKQGLKNDLKIIQWTEKIDENRIQKVAEDLEKFLEMNKDH